MGEMRGGKPVRIVLILPPHGQNGDSGCKVMRRNGLACSLSGGGEGSMLCLF